MSAEVLRKAAALMRERAEKATAEVCPEWTRAAVRHIARNCEIECYHDQGSISAAHPKHHDSEGEPNQWSRYDDADHIASWHPAVALAVADLMDTAATHQVGFTPVARERITAVARAYLGEAS